VRLHSKHKFTAEEDARLAAIVARQGESNWKRIAAQLGGRNCRQCRERWKNYLDPNLSKAPWTVQEDALLLAMYREHGSRWTVIAKEFPARTDVNCKNRWVVLTSHGDPPKRSRTKPVKVQPKDTDPDTWIWNDVEARQSYEDAEPFGLDGTGFIMN
jgi:hypothetical protein